MDDENGSPDPADEPVIGQPPAAGGPPSDYDPPESATPSVYLYRGSLVALVLGSFVALFLVLNPPADESGVDEPREIATNTPAFLETATATPQGATPEGSPTPALSATPSEQTTPTPNTSTEEYEVQPGDTFGEIASDHGITADELQALNPEITDPDSLGVGDVILVPAATE